MLDELRALLASCGPDATRDDYLAAIHNDNCLGQAHGGDSENLESASFGVICDSTRRCFCFRIMRRCWYADRAGQPVLALLLALARDPLLRASVPPILRMRPGEELARQQLTDALNQAVGHRLNESTLDTVVRNVASSWTQSGHLRGHSRKVRQTVTPTAANTAFALLLGHLAGKRGTTLFESLWAQVLDSPPGELVHLAMDARRLGFLDMRQSGGVIDVAFSRLLAADGRW